MKKNILIICFIFCCKFITAKESDNYQTFVAFIDSLKNEYSIKQFINNVMIDLPHYYRNSYSELSEEEQNKIWDHISELYNQTEYLGLYGLGGVLLDEYYGRSKNSVKKRMIEINFDKISYMSSEVINFGESEYYTQHAKDRLLEIAEKRWNEEDIKAWTVMITQTLNMEKYKRDVKEIMKETNRQGADVEKYLLDSLIDNRITNSLQANVNRPIYKRCIMIIGSLNDQRFVPALENMLEEYKENKDYPEIKEACTYALAKLGVQKYLDEVYSREYFYYRYLGTKEAYLKYLDKKFVWNKADVVYPHEKYRPSAIVVLDETIYLSAYLLNIPDSIKKEYGSIDMNYVIPENFTGQGYDPDKDEKNKESIQKARYIYKWIKENSDVWELPPAKDTF